MVKGHCDLVSQLAEHLSHVLVNWCTGESSAAAMGTTPTYGSLPHVIPSISPPFLSYLQLSYKLKVLNAPQNLLFYCFKSYCDFTKHIFGHNSYWEYVTKLQLLIRKSWWLHRLHGGALHSNESTLVCMPFIGVGVDSRSMTRNGNLCRTTSP